MALGDQCQQLPFTRGQRAQWVVPALSGEQLGDDLRIEDRPATGDPVQGVQELLDLGDPVLEQIADGAGTVREQIGRVGHLHVLAEHQHGRAG